MRLSLALVVFTLLPGNPGAAIAGTGPELRSELMVEPGQRLTALDLVEGGSESLNACLREIVLGDAPRATSARVIRRRDVVLAAKEAGCELGPETLGGAPRSRVVARGLSLSKEEVMRALEPLRIQAALQGLDAGIEIFRMPSPLALPPGTHTLRMTAGFERLRPGRMQIPLVVVAGAAERRTQVSVRLHLSGDVCVAARSLGHGHSLGRGDVHVARAELPPRCDPVVDAEDVLGAELRFSLQKGDVLCRRHARIPPTIDVGDPVLVTLESGEVSLRFETRARGRGFVGDRVRVVGLDGRTLVDATILGPGRAEVRQSTDIARSEP